MGIVSQSETLHLPLLVTPVVFLLLGLPSTRGRRQLLLSPMAMPYPRNMDFPRPVVPSFMTQHYVIEQIHNIRHNFSFYPLPLALNLLTSKTTVTFGGSHYTAYEPGGGDHCTHCCPIWAERSLAHFLSNRLVCNPNLSLELYRVSEERFLGLPAAKSQVQRLFLSPFTEGFDFLSPLKEGH